MIEKQYIEREAAISAFANYLGATFGAVSHRTARTVECILKPIPAAPVMERTQEAAIDYLRNIGWLQDHDRILTETAPVREVVRGRWELDTFETTATCSVCCCCIPIEWKDDDIRWDFCPNCGADMRTEEGGAT